MTGLAQRIETGMKEAGGNDRQDLDRRIATTEAMLSGLREERDRMDLHDTLTLFDPDPIDDPDFGKQRKSHESALADRLRENEVMDDCNVMETDA
jgi:hypothetical protein